MSAKRLSIYLLLTLACVVIWGFHHYSARQIPQRVAESTATIQKVDSIRFAFKTALLAKKGALLYLEAIEEQSETLLIEAVDHFDAAIAFINIVHTRDPVYLQQVMPKLDQILRLINSQGLQISSADMLRLKALVDEIYTISEKRERQIWTEVQIDYVEFQANEYKVSQLYQTLALAASLFLIVVLGQLIYHMSLLRSIRRNESDLQRLAYYDPLTETPNRKLLERLLGDELARAQRIGQRCFIVMIDIDDFKRVNDLLGHAVGDSVIVEAARRLQQVLRRQDEIGRLGGDEFLLILSEPFDQGGILGIVERIHEAFELPIIVQRREFYITVSLGIAHSREPDQALITVHELMRRADIAMYRAKFEGRNRFHIYDKKLSARIEQEHQLEGEIKNGIEHDEFVLFYQPQVDAHTGRVVSVEALARWQHPERGLLYPDAFIAMVEKSTLAKPFGEWVLRSAVQQQKAWQQQGIDMVISINLSAKHILAHDFVPSMRALVDELQADLSQLHFEITEYELITHEASGFDKLHQLAERGFILYLDDFGTGYSSLSYLEKLPLSGIKIDKSFIDSIGSAGDKYRMVNGILTIAQAMGLKVVAEGVESYQQAEYLIVSGCDYLQGYLLSKPLPGPQATAIILKQDLLHCAEKLQSEVWP